ncbi:MAG: hypothetical protein ACOYOK_09605 [Pseudobdellovibrionaceae bacterium]
MARFFQIKSAGFIMAVCFLSACARPTYLAESKNSADVINQELPASSCKNTFTKSGFCLSWQWETKPTSSQSGSFIFKTYRANYFDQSSVLLDWSALPEVILWMPSMGHGSTPTEVERLDVGTYRVKKVFFVMPGDWDLQFFIKENSEVKDDAVISVSI